MIATLLMAVGILSALAGLIWTVYIAMTPILVKMRTINGQGEIIETSKIRRIRIRDRKYLARISVCMMITGLLIFFSGYYIGFAEKGNGFWFHRLVFGSEDIGADRINADGEYVSENGSTYKHYIRISGRKIEYCGEICRDISALEGKLIQDKSKIMSVLIVDDYAVAAEYKDAEKLLKSMGIKYETERNG